MSELIKREDAINAVAELQGIAQSKAELTGISKAWKMIKALPTVDAVPVVRCGECKHGEPDTNCIGEKAIRCEHEDNPYGGGVWLMNPNWFCADGERRTE